MRRRPANIDARVWTSGERHRLTGFASHTVAPLAGARPLLTKVRLAGAQSQIFDP